MKRIAIFTDFQLPIPAVQGGSVPSLIEFILEQNEVEKQLDIDVFSCYDEEARKASMKYSCSKFIFSKDAKYVRFTTNLKFVIKNKLHIPFDLSRIPLPKSVEKYFASQKYDVVYISGYVRGALPIIKIAKQKGSKVIVHHHTVTDYLHDATIRGGEIIENSDSVVFVSEFAANYTRVGTPEQNKKIGVFLNAIDVNKFILQNRFFDREAIRTKYQIEKEDVVVLFVGRMVANKGALELIRAFNMLTNQDNVKLLVVGGATYNSTKVSNYVKKCLDEARHNPNIIFTGYVNYAEIPKYYAAADISTLISRCDEACGLVGIESMAAGLPIITTDRGGIGEYISEGCKIVVGDDNDLETNIRIALEKLCNSSDLRKTMGHQGVDRAKHFAKEKYYWRFIELLESIFKN